MSEQRITELRRAYLVIHEQVLRAYRREVDPDIAGLQRSEQRIVRELRSLGAEPYESQILRDARAL